MLEARGLMLRFGSVAALDGFALTVPDGHVVSVLGPSGCGKSTLLRVIAGLQSVEAGSGTAGPCATRHPTGVDSG
jgi:ABC-type Fe3+/spermidine/putrescine transport system ATPase subunit